LSMGMVFCAISFAQEPGCIDTTALGRMARATSIAALKARKLRTGDSYRAQVVFAARMLETDPKNRGAAESLLNLIPKEIDGPEQAVWLELDELDQCISGGLSESDLNALWLLQHHLPRLLAKAVLLVTNKMPEYVAYAYISIQNPDSDYAIQMKRVCRAQHRIFLSAVEKMPTEDRKWFMEKIFSPNDCHALALPEQ